MKRYDQQQIAEALEHAIEECHHDVMEILAKHVDRDHIGIEEADGDAEDFGQPGKLWVVSEHRLIVGGYEVANWTRCNSGGYSNGQWETEEDTEGGDRLPFAVGRLLDLLGLEDSLPSVPEPETPDHPQDPAGNYCVYWETVGDDEAVISRYATLEEASEMLEVYDRKFKSANPGVGYLCGYSVRVLDGDKWVGCDDDE